METSRVEEYNIAGKMVLSVLGQHIGVEDPGYVMGELERYGVKGTWFDGEDEAALYEAMVQVWREHKCLDLMRVNEAFTKAAEGKWSFMQTYHRVMGSEASQVASIAQYEYYLTMLKQKVVYATVHRLTMGWLSDLTPDNVAVHVEDLARQLHDVQEDMAETDGGLKTLADYMEASVATKMKLHEERFVKHNWSYLDGLPWPWKEVDQIFAGLKKGLHVVAALASNGKSAMAANLSCFWNERGIKHGIFSIDMSSDQLADRYPCIMERVSLAKLNFGTTKGDVERFAEGYRKAARGGNVWLSEVYDAKEMEYQCFRGVKSLGWKAIIIDYIQLVSPNEKGNVPEYTRVQRAVQAVKSIAKRLKVPVICLAQLSRAFEKELRDNKGGEPGLDSIGDSAEIARAAASITLLYQDEGMRQYWKDEPPTQLAFGDRGDRAVACGVVGRETHEEAEARRRGQVSLAKQLRPVWFDVKKNQQGRTGKLPFVMFPNYFLFRPGNSEGGVSEVEVCGKTKKLPVQMFEQIRDDWTWTEQDWWLEMTNALPQRGCKLLGETFAEMRERLAAERAQHKGVKHFVRQYDERGMECGWHWE